jgi:hypothetical protein
MTDTPLPKNVYHLAQKEFDAIPGSPWVYWVSDDIRSLFHSMPSLRNYSQPKHGLSTCDNFRFLRYWWEIGKSAVRFGITNIDEGIRSKAKWFPYMKGGPIKRWYGNQSHVVNWLEDGQEIKADIVRRFPYLKGNWGMVVTNPNFYFHEGITWSDLTSGLFHARISPGGFIFDVKGSSAFPDDICHVLALLNSLFANYLLSLLNPTVSFQVGDISRLPIPLKVNPLLNILVLRAIHLSKLISMHEEFTFDFIAPSHLYVYVQDITTILNRIPNIENQINTEVFNLYEIAPHIQVAIGAEITGALSSEDEYEEERKESDEESTEKQDDPEFSLCWISYAVGVILSRYQPGVPGELGSAIYHCSDFAIGSLPAPDEAAFDELVGRPESFAYIDPQGGRHVFSPQVEKALQALALPDGIAVRDEGHPRDLVKLVTLALELMLGEAQAREVIQSGAGGDLRKFLEKDFFTAWHLKWYRKRPVYWPIQSSRRSYGFVLFHEKITRDTFYAIQREPYLDTKRNAVALQIADLQGALLRATGTQRKQLEKQLDELRKLADELAAFAKDLEAITLGGYEPEENWIDDGVILRMAPLWKVIPIWKSEPKKYWERLEAGDFDWSHIAMRYWPERVKKACEKNKSYAIAHGYEEWFKS